MAYFRDVRTGFHVVVELDIKSDLSFSPGATAALLYARRIKEAAVIASERTRRERELLGLIAAGMTPPRNGRPTVPSHGHNQNPLQKKGAQTGCEQYGWGDEVGVGG